MNELEALAHRLERERKARQEAERLLEEKSRALYLAVEESSHLAEELRQTVGFQTHELLDAQRVARVGTFIWDINAEQITWSEGVYSILGIDHTVETLSLERYLDSVLAEDRVALMAQIDRAREAGFDPGGGAAASGQRQGQRHRAHPDGGRERSGVRRLMWEMRVSSRLT